MEDRERASTGACGWGWGFSRVGGAEAKGDSNPLSTAASTLVIDLGSFEGRRDETSGIVEREGQRAE